MLSHNTYITCSHPILFLSFLFRFCFSFSRCTLLAASDGNHVATVVLLESVCRPPSRLLFLLAHFGGEIGQCLLALETGVFDDTYGTVELARYFSDKARRGVEMMGWKGRVRECGSHYCCASYAMLAVFGVRKRQVKQTYRHQHPRRSYHSR